MRQLPGFLMGAKPLSLLKSIIKKQASRAGPVRGSRLRAVLWDPLAHTPGPCEETHWPLPCLESQDALPLATRMKI